jgi:hypothetical protein
VGKPEFMGKTRASPRVTRSLTELNKVVSLHSSFFAPVQGSQPSFSSSGQRTSPSVAASCSSIAFPPSRSGFHAAIIIQQQRPADLALRRSCRSITSPPNRSGFRACSQPVHSSSGGVSPLGRGALPSL